MSWLNSVGVILSESAVEPRISMKSIDMGTSAPPGNSREAISHKLQYRGFIAERSLPNNTRAIIAPIPWKGVLQNLQRGSCGSMRMTRRSRLSTAKALVVNQNHQTLPTSTDFFSFMSNANLYFPATHSPASDGPDDQQDQEPSFPVQLLDTGDKELVLARLLPLSCALHARQDLKSVHYRAPHRAQTQ